MNALNAETPYMAAETSDFAARSAIARLRAEDTAESLEAH